MKQSKISQFLGLIIFVGIDVHVKSWNVSIATQAGLFKTFTQDPSPERLARYLRKNFPGGQYAAVYEAGYCGFWIHDDLTRLGIKTFVINPADVPTKNKERVNKNDRVDSLKLVRNLAAGNLDPIYVPSREALEDRSLVRTRDHLKRKQTRVKNQIKAMLRFYGIQLPEPAKWSNAMLDWLDGLTTGKVEGFESESGRIALKLHLDELLSLKKQVRETMRQIKRLSQTERYRDRVKNLCSIAGIAFYTAMIILTELVHIERFPTFDHLASFVGLIPSKPGSGDYDPDGFITPRRHARLRHAIIESAWTAKRIDPDQCAAYLKLTKRMTKSQAITRIARKQLTRVYYVLTNNQPLS